MVDEVEVARWEEAFTDLTLTATGGGKEEELLAAAAQEIKEETDRRWPSYDGGNKGRWRKGF